MGLLDFHADIQASIHPDKVRIAQNILAKHFDIVSYEQADIKEENSHSDVHFKVRDGQVLHCDLKHYSKGKNANFVCLEMFSDIRKSNGWTFNLKVGGVDLLLFIWHGKSKLCYLLANASLLEDWFRANYRNYDLIKNKPTVDNSTGNWWQSGFMRVPIKDLPPEVRVFWERFIDLGDFL